MWQLLLSLTMTLVSDTNISVYIINSQRISYDAEVNAGFERLEYTAEETAGVLEVCVQVFGTATLSQTTLVRVETMPGSAEGIH